MKDCWAETTTVPSEKQAEAVSTFDPKVDTGVDTKEERWIL